MSIMLVVGLGNPGPEYAETRHNLGWKAVDAVAVKFGLSWRSQPAFTAEIAKGTSDSIPRLWLAKPHTFMNDSGRSVSALMRYHRIPSTSVVAVFDDINIELGSLKVAENGGPGGHNGVASLIGQIGPEFTRFRLGIGPKQPAEIDIKDFVLGRFTPDQNNLIQQKLISYVNGLELLLTHGPSAAMSQLNRRPSSP